MKDPKVWWGVIITAITLFIGIKEYQIFTLINKPRLHIVSVNRFSPEDTLPKGHNKKISHIFVIANKGPLDAENVCISVRTSYIGRTVHEDKSDCSIGTLVSTSETGYSIFVHELPPDADISTGELLENIEINYVGGPKYFSLFGKTKCSYIYKMRFMESVNWWTAEEGSDVTKCQ